MFILIYLSNTVCVRSDVNVLGKLDNILSQNLVNDLGGQQLRIIFRCLTIDTNGGLFPVQFFEVIKGHRIDNPFEAMLGHCDAALFEQLIVRLAAL